MDIGQFYQHRDLYDKCRSCRSCVDKGYLRTSFEERRLPLPWQGTVGPSVRVLFFFARPSFTKPLPRLSDYPNGPALRTMLDEQYEEHAIAFKRRRSAERSMRTYARKITSILLESPESSISDFDDYLFTSLVRCNGDWKPGLKSLEAPVADCLDLHGGALFERLPGLQWIVLVGSAAHEMLSLPAAWVKFRKASQVRDSLENLDLPPLACGVSEVISLNDRLRLVAVPYFSRRIFQVEHYRRIFASWMTRPPLPDAGSHPPVNGAPRAAREGRARA